MSRNTKEILLVQLFSNGDCLYATTVAQQIKVDFPGCRLTWAIASFCKDIIANNPFVDDVMIITSVPKNDIRSFRKLKKEFRRQKRSGTWDEVFVTTNMDNNQALYDGTIRGMIFRAYPKHLTVPVEPVLVLSDKEKTKVAIFAEERGLSNFRHVILWEYAPQSGQSVLHFDFVMRVAERVSSSPSTCVILSSANPFKSTERIFDASGLSVRENAALTHYCNLLIGCSSGITWISTSSAGKKLPMVQLLNPLADFLNAPSVDFFRYGKSTDQLIEITDINAETVFGCINTITGIGFEPAREKYNVKLPIQFNTTRKVVYNMLCYLQFAAIAKHYRIITSIYGLHPLFLKQFFLAILSFPFKLLINFFKKRISNTR